MLRNLKKNKQGFVFVMILVTIIVMMVLVISVISVNLTHTMATEGEIKRMRAEQIAYGYRDVARHWAHTTLDDQDLIASNGFRRTGFWFNQSVKIDGTLYNPIYYMTIDNTDGLYGTSPLIINVVY